MKLSPGCATRVYVFRCVQCMQTAYVQRQQLGPAEKMIRATYEWQKQKGKWICRACIIENRVRKQDWAR